MKCHFFIPIHAFINIGVCSYLTYSGAVAIETGLSDQFDDFTFGVILCGINAAVLFVSFLVAYIRVMHDRKLKRRKREALVKKVGVLVSFFISHLGL